MITELKETTCHNILEYCIFKPRTFFDVYVFQKKDANKIKMTFNCELWGKITFRKRHHFISLYNGI